MMPDKKLTDSEIAKALESCENVDYYKITNALCAKCAYHKNKDCKTLLMQDAIDLINRQKAEIKEYEKVVGKLGRKDGKVICVLKGKETEYIPTDIASVYRKLAISKAKAEAYKECIEKVYKFICDTKNWGVLHREFLENGECYWLKQKFDNLLKELVGDDK